MSKTTYKILVVDDHPTNVEYLRRMITDWGYEVVVAYRGIQALKVAQEERPDLVLLDVVMPDLTGYEVCRALKVHPDTTFIPVIFLTVKGEIFDRVEGMDMGAHDYVAKPFHPDELKARIKIALIHKDEKEKLRKEKEELQSHSIVDDATGFYNRRYLNERLSEELSRAKRYNYSLSLALITPDEFENMPKEYSRSAINNTIKQIGEVIKRNIRAIDMITKFDDHAFAILLPQTGQDGAAAFGEKIRKAIERHLFYGIIEKRKLTVSIGVGVYEPDSEGAMGAFIDEAVKALKTSQKNKNNVIVFEV